MNWRKYRVLCRDIIKLLNEKYPRTDALEWDHVGLLVGRRDKEVKKVYVAPQSEIVKLIGKEHTMQMDLGFGTQTGSGGGYNEMY